MTRKMHTQDVFRGPARGGGPSSLGRLGEGWVGGEGGGTPLLGAAGSVIWSTSFLAAWGMWKGKTLKYHRTQIN